MTQTALILGPTGRFGRNAAQSFETAGWAVRRFKRGTDLMQAAQGADVIVNGWNPAYTDWARDLPGLTAQVIKAARASDATVIIPGNVYVFGAPGTWGPDTPHKAQNPMGRLRIEMEQTYRESGVQVINLRAGDFIDTEASGNWFDLIMTKTFAKGVFTYPGAPDARRAWAYLPDVARAAVALAEKRTQLPQYSDIPFPGYTLSGHDLCDAISNATGKPQRVKRMAWWPIRMAGLVWPMGRRLVEMSYLWSMPHQLDPTRFHDLLPDFKPTDLTTALRTALPKT